MHLSRVSHSPLLGFTQDRDCNIFMVPEKSRRIPKNQKGQVAVEFALMIIVIMIVTLSYMSITFLGTQGYLTKFASYTGARGYLAYSNGFGDGWRDGARQNSELIINRASQADIQRVGGGVKVRILVQELFPVLKIYGPHGVTELEATTELGEEDPMDGDNVL
jgi:hypothetical protein